MPVFLNISENHCDLSSPGGSKGSKKQTSGSTSNAVTTVGGEREEGSDISGDEDVIDNLEEGHGGEKQVRETERRYANNARER